MFLKNLILAAALAAPLAALASGTATIQGGDGRFTLQYDAASLRLDSDKYRNLYLLSRDNTVYAVSSAAGQPIVVEGAAVFGLLGARGDSAQFATGSEDIERFVSLDGTSRTETVGGIRGEVYNLTYVDRNGRRRTVDVVLSANPALVELTQKFGTAAAQFQSEAGVENRGARDMLDELQSRGLGLLRFAEHYRLIALDTAAPDPSRFRLPARPMQLPALQGLESMLPGLTGRR